MNLAGDPRLNRSQQGAAYKIGDWQRDQEALVSQWREAEDKGNEAALRELDELAHIHLAHRPFEFVAGPAPARVLLCDGCEFQVTRAGRDTTNVEIDRPRPR